MSSPADASEFYGFAPLGITLHFLSPAGTGRRADRCSRKPPEKIDRAVSLAFEFAVAHEAIESRAGLAIIGGADQPRDRCAGLRPCKRLIAGNLPTAAYGTNQTSRAGLAMSVDWGRPGVTGSG
jgi:hypothetical protein